MTRFVDECHVCGRSNIGTSTALLFQTVVEREERERKMEREGHTVKVFAKDKPQTSKVDVPSEWTPSGIHSTPCDRGLFVTARKKLDTLCLQLEAPWDALNVSKALPVIHHFQMFELNFDEYFNFYERITIVDS